MNQALSPIRAGARAVALVPQTFDELQRMAKVFLLSKTFKPSWQAEKAMEGEDGSTEQATAECCIVIQRGLDVGLSPTQAVEGIAIINGKTLIYGETLSALLLAGGCKIKKWTDGEGDQMIGHARITRPDGEVIEKSYSYQQADSALLIDHRETVKRKVWDNTAKTKIWKDVPNDSVWRRFTDRMLEWRAFGFAVKDGASDYSKGLQIVEEMAPYVNDPVDVTPVPTALPDIPDIPEIIPEPEEQAQLKDDEPLADQDGFVEMLRSSVSACDDRSEFREVITANAPLTRRCSTENRDRIAELYRECMS